MTIKGTQLSPFTTSLSGLTQKPSSPERGQWYLYLNPSGALEVTASGLNVKNNGIVSSMIAANSILAAHIGFDAGDVPNSSGVVGLTVEDALDQLDTDVSSKLPLAGGTMAGDIVMAGNRVTLLSDALAAQDAVTLKQMQDYVTLGRQWLYPCAYGEPSDTNSCLLPTGKVRASQSLYMSSVPNDGEEVVFDGATLTFKNSPAGPNDVQIVGSSVSTTCTNLVNTINSATAPVNQAPNPALSVAAFAIREENTGQTVHVVWKNTDGTPTNSNGLICSTTAAGIAFVNIDASTGNARFYGAYDTASEGATIQGRRDNAVFCYNVDEQDWTLIYANPGTDFFSYLSGDYGGVQSAGSSGTIFVDGGAAIKTTTSTDPVGGRVTIDHLDAHTDLSMFHAEESIYLNSAYGNVGTAVADSQADFNAATNSLMGEAKGAVKNILVNGAFIDDPVGASPYSAAGPLTAPAMPGWAVYAPDAGATIDASFSAVAPKFGTYHARLNNIALGALGYVEFYQPVGEPGLYSGQKFGFSAWVNVATASAVRLFIKSSAGRVYSAYHDGSGTYKQLTVHTTLAAAETEIKVGVHCEIAGITVDVDACMAIVGSAYTTIQYVPRPEVEDRLAISALYHKLAGFQYMVWAQPVLDMGGQAHVKVSIPYPTTMITTPTPTIDFVPYVQPAGATPTAGVTAVTDRMITLDVTDTANNWQTPAVSLPDAFMADVYLDARPT